MSFPILLDLAPVCKNHKKPRIYSLYGVVEHSGTVHGGHYVAYVKVKKKKNNYVLSRRNSLKNIAKVENTQKLVFVDKTAISTGRSSVEFSS